MSEKSEKEAKSKGTSRREFIAATGAAVAGLAVGAAIGSQAFPKTVELPGVVRTETRTATVTAPATTVTVPGAVTTVTAPAVVAPPYWPPPDGLKNLNPEHDKCTGCRLCEYACVKQHYGNIINPELSRVRVYHFFPGNTAVPIQCSNCDDRPCVAVCPTSPPAITFDEKKFILKVDKTRCLGYKCSKCADECKAKRSGAIHFFPPDHDYAIVCDQCDGAGPNGEPDPQCARICPWGVFFYWTPFGGRAFRYAWPPEKLAQDLADRFYPATKDKRLRLPPEIQL